MKFGTVAIIGRSNVGKSTLLNRLFKEKIAIVSEKPQTTRTRILGVVHAPGAQIALLDTTGIHKPEHLLNRRMVRTTVETLDEADLIYVLMEATSLPGPGDLMVLDHVNAALKKHDQLYDLQDDIEELNDLFTRDSFSASIMRDELLDALATTNDSLRIR